MAFDITSYILGKKSAGGGGGGGSSDFTTATVTIVNGAILAYNFPNLYDDGELTASAPSFFTQSDSETATAILYKGACIADLQNVTTYKTVSISGDIEDIGYGAYLITGDCTITIS